MSFFQKLVQETEIVRSELYKVPQLVNALQGNISVDTYRDYLVEAFHHVSHTVPFLMTMGANLPQDKIFLQKVIAEYIQEEIGHEEWILNDIEAVGGDKNVVRNSMPILETQVLISYNYDYLKRKNPVGFLGMVFMLESTSIAIANAGADAIRKSLNLPDNAFSYLQSHGDLDVSHMKFFEKTLTQISDPKDQAAIIEVAQNTFVLFANILRTIPYKKELQDAA